MRIARPARRPPGDDRAARRAEDDALRRLTSAVAAQMDPEAVARLATELAAGLAGGHVALVCEYAGAEARTLSAWRSRPGRVDDLRPVTGDGALARVLRSGGAVRVDYSALAADDPAATLARRAGCAHAVGTPVRVSGRLWGALIVARDEPFAPAAERGLGMVADLVGLGVAGARARERSASGALSALVRALDAKDPETRRHSERVAGLSARLGTALAWSRERVELLYEAALLHDVGKIAVPDAVLFKPGGLSPAERELVSGHAALGAEIAGDALTAEQRGWIRHHHERPDGGGYPDGLAGAAIPEGARILAVADSWDVLTVARAYRGPLPPAVALAEIADAAGAQFCPRVVGALVRLVPDARRT